MPPVVHDAQWLAEICRKPPALRHHRAPKAHKRCVVAQCPRKIRTAFALHVLPLVGHARIQEQPYFYAQITAQITHTGRYYVSTNSAGVRGATVLEYTMTQGLDDASANFQFPTSMSIPVFIPTSASPSGTVLHLPPDDYPDVESSLDVIFTKVTQRRLINQDVGFHQLSLHSLVRISQN